MKEKDEVIFKDLGDRVADFLWPIFYANGWNWQGGCPSKEDIAETVIKHSKDLFAPNVNLWTAAGRLIYVPSRDELTNKVDQVRVCLQIAEIDNSTGQFLVRLARQ